MLHCLSIQLPKLINVCTLPVVLYTTPVVYSYGAVKTAREDVLKVLKRIMFVAALCGRYRIVQSWNCLYCMQ